ncbi:hypothetical protein LTR17_013650 [Elasticomyces elasticus]|nr:hypothetical protein LTR17_013650 [Elasticomyces elasticus]
MTFSAAELYEDHELSDVIIAFRDYEVPAHKLILSCRSTWFRAALKMNTRGFIRLHVKEDDADIVASILSWIYTSVYPPFDTEAPELWRYHLRIAAVAEKYGVATLWEAAMEKFDSVPISSIEEAAAMLHTLLAYRQSATHPCERGRLLQPEEFLEILQEAEDTTFCTDQPRKPLDYISLLADAVAERTEIMCEEQATITRNKLFSGLRFSTNDLREMRDAAVSECQVERPQESMVYVTLLTDEVADKEEEVVCEEPSRSAALMRKRLFSALKTSTSNLREAWKAAVSARLENHGEGLVGCET